MQPLSPGGLAAVSPPHADYSAVITRLYEFGNRDEVRSLFHGVLIVFACAQVVAVCAYWITAKLIIGDERATAGNALKLWLLYLLTGLLLFAVVCLALFFGAIGGPLMFIAMMAGCAALYVIWLLFLPMKVYGIGILHSLLFVALTMALDYGGRTFLGKTLDLSDRVQAVEATKGATPAERQRFTERLFGKDAPDEIDRLLDDTIIPFGKPKPLAAREETVRSIQQKLEVRRRAVPAGDPAFQQQLGRYKVLLAAVKAERAAAPNPTGH